MKRVVAALLLSVLALPAVSAVAASPAFGARAGMTINPDQIHFGGHVQALEFAKGFWLVPNLEVGFGDHATLFAINGEVNYTFPRTDWKTWRPYVGGGLGWNIWDTDGPGDGNDIGLNVLLGVMRTLNLGYDFFGEVKLGLEDSPDAKITLGLTFH